ncbi:hypothetical protein [Ideonella sp. A 288]|uniref:hypothetical protein n=1 Tax=Ideonella sp. A 288 TaxID=1962181 RepID=UPI000B4BCACF|nr:hypothetical protein [Ideonella sp. A 288]
MTPDELDTALDQLRAGRADVARLAADLRATAADWPGLPARYGQVLEHLLAPLESSALFQEESCSFSAADLADQLAQWLRLAEAAAPRPATSAGTGAGSCG